MHFDCDEEGPRAAEGERERESMHGTQKGHSSAAPHSFAHVDGGADEVFRRFPPLSPHARPSRPLLLADDDDEEEEREEKQRENCGEQRSSCRVQTFAYC